MDLIIADKNGHQILQMLSVEFDCELNDGDRDFDLYLDIHNFDSRITFGCQFFIPDTEIGGIIGRRSADSSLDTVSLTGYTWRGLLQKKIVLPPSGEAYYVCNGDLHAVARDLVNNRFGGIIQVPEEDCGVSVTDFQLDRFCTVLDALDAVFSSVNYKINLSYQVGEPNDVGKVILTAVPIVDFTNEIEISGNDQLSYISEDIKNGVNHLVIGNEDPDTSQTTLDLYVQPDGKIGTKQYYFGIDEIEEFYSSGSSAASEVKDKAKEYLLGVANSTDLDLSILDLRLDAKIGDIIGGYDYLSGQEIKQKITNIVYQYKNDELKKEYKTQKEES